MNEQAHRLLPLLDLTSLNDNDDQAAIERLCGRAVTPFGRVAAVCTWPRFVGLCKNRLEGSGVRIATVANFPHGKDDPESVLAEIGQAIAAGADEVDLVLPYQRWLAGERDLACTLVSAGKQVCGPKVLLKVILETGELATPRHTAEASRDAIAAGADFLKTSTGKTAVGATLAAATVMLAAIKESGKTVGFKAAGGIRTPAEALSYRQLAEGIMGRGWAVPATFRIGASALLDALLEVLRYDGCS
ncbi:MAG: deoxyribose-phosphate aldolase [Candidatus Competibacteraceae bacterium]